MRTMISKLVNNNENVEQVALSAQILSTVCSVYTVRVLCDQTFL